MNRFRISLRSLLLIVTAIGLFLGYSQHRRRAILNASNELKDFGYMFAVPDRWRDRLWQRRPVTGTKFISENQELLRLDLQSGAEGLQVFANLEILGVTRESVEAFQRMEEVKQEQRRRYRALLLEQQRRQAERQ
jgi:hypothetical protein